MSLADDLINERGTVDSLVSSGIIDSPDNAARALQLSRSSGVPAPIIDGDLEGFERQHKADLATQLLRSNTALADYVQANPLAAKLSNDDYGNLDALSEGTRKLGKRGALATAAEWYKNGVVNVFSASGEAFKAGYKPDEQLQGVNELLASPGARYLQTQPVGGMLIAGGVAFDTGMRVMTGATYAVAAALAEGAENVGLTNLSVGGTQLTGSKESLIRDIIIGINVGTAGEGGFIRHTVATRQFNELAREARQIGKTVEPWLNEGREPPAGMFAILDDLKIEQAKIDVDNLLDLTKTAQQSLTRERSPEMFRDFAARDADGEIGISADAVRAIYKDKPPTPDDGILGFVPRLAEQLATAEQYGGDVKVPLADWLAYVDPTVAREIKDYIRVRKDGMTIAEGQAERLERPMWGNPIDDLRSVSGLEPMLMAPEAKVRLRRVGEGKEFPDVGEGRFHDFEFADEQGNAAGYVIINESKDGKTLYVEDVQAVLGERGDMPNVFGPKAMRQILRQIKEEFPNAESLTGHRVSGAREAAGVIDKMPMAEVKLDAPEGWGYADTANKFARILEGGEWRPISVESGFKAYVKPRESYRDKEAEIIAAVDAELQRIAPSAAVLPAEKISQGAWGLHTQAGWKKSLPALIAWSFEGGAPLKTARHEAIHHLRQRGLFTPEEWSVLEEASKKHGWEKQFNIAERYEGKEGFVKIEESIAEAYSYWRQGKLEVDGVVAKLFERLKELLEGLKYMIRERLGADVKWEDIFQAIDRGDIGLRSDFSSITGYEANVRGGRPIPASWREMVANDENAFGGQRKPSYDTALKEQLFKKYIDENTEKGDFEYWHKIAEVEGHILMKSPNAMRAARAHSVGGKTTLVIGIDGKRTLFQDGEKVLWDRYRDIVSPEPMAQKPPKPPKETQLDFINEVTRMEDREVFDRASAVGMTVQNYRRYMKLIEKLRSEDEARQLARATEAERKRQTAEWKANYKTMREQVKTDLELRPDWQADKMIQDGLRLDADSLTEEQKAALPRRYYNQGEDAVAPSVLADLVGYPDGNALIEGLAAFVAPRAGAKMQPMEYTRRLIDIETDARMEATYGDLQKNILEEAKEHVLSETQLDLLHEETLALASQAGVQLSIPKDALLSQIREGFESTLAGQVDSGEYLAAVGRAGRAVEEALLKGDAQEAFRQKQKQFFATSYAREAAKFEREQVKFAKIADRYSRREGPKNVDRPFIDHIQSLLLQAGFNVRRTSAELAEARGMSGFASLDSFVEFNRQLGWEPAVTDAIQAGQFKRIDEMTVEEFREFRDAVQSLDHIGKQVKKIEVAGRTMDFEEWRTETIENIVEAFPDLRKDTARLKGLEKKIDQLRSSGFAYDAMITRMEEVMKDLDGRKDAGPLFSAIIRPMAESKHTEYSMLEDLTRKLRSLRGADKKWRKTLNDTIQQDFLVDPLDGSMFDLDRQQMINIMLNWGNESNIKKFTHGYFGKEYAEWGKAKLEALFERHATKEDWDFVQNMWDIFKGWEPAIKKLYYDTSGVPPKLIDSREVVTKHGTYRGGYFPIIYDRLRSGIGVIQDRSPVNDSGTFARDYFRSTTGNGYTKARTGYVDYVEFATTLDQVGSRMQQMIHDIAYRRAVIDTTKIIYDRKLRETIRNHYGIEYEKQLNPWLKDVANHFNQNEDAVSSANNFFRRLRYNLMGHALGLNLKVLGSPDVGALNPMAIARTLRNYDDSVALAWEKSKEIPHTFRNMDRDFRENLERIVADNKLDQWSSDAVRFAFYPIVKISQGFRIITFVEEYNKALARGLDDGAASAHADSIVRERHGSAGLPDLPSAMRSSEAMKWSTLFYGYFNTMYNWQRQIPGQLRRGEWMEAAKTSYGAIGIGAVFGAMFFNQQRESDSWYGRIAKALALQVSGTLWVAREGFNYLIEGFPSRTPFNNLVNAVGASINDVRKAIKKQPIEKPIQHTANVIGLSTGLPLGQIGRSAQFIHDVNRGKQRPRNVMEWTRGIIHGEARLKP